VVPVPMVVLEVAVAIAAAALLLEAAVRQIIDEEALASVKRMGLTLTATDREYHRVDGATLIAAVVPVPPPDPCTTENSPPSWYRYGGACRRRNTFTTSLRGPSISPIISFTMWALLLVEAAGDHRLDEVVLWSTSHSCSSRISIRAVRRLVLVSRRRTPLSPEMFVLEADVAHAGAVATVRSHRKI